MTDRIRRDDWGAELPETSDAETSELDEGLDADLLEQLRERVLHFAALAEQLDAVPAAKPD